MENRIELEETYDRNICEIKLRLSFETRFIGVLVSKSEGALICKRKACHLFRKQNSLGINQELLTSPSIKFKWIVIDFEGQKLITTRKYFLAKGEQFQFGKKGFELQVFLPLNEFGIEKAKAFQLNNGEQTSFNFYE